jgi:hypothetical protein
VAPPLETIDMKATLLMPRVIQAAGNKPKSIEEYVGRLATDTSAVSVARMVSSGSMREVYEVLEQVLKDSGRGDAIAGMHQHIHALRKPVDWMRARVERAGFRDCQVIERSFRWRFSSAEALFEHGFFRLAFIPPWQALVREEERKAVFDELEARIEARAVAEGELSLTIPYACFDCAR